MTSRCGRTRKLPRRWGLRWDRSDLSGNGAWNACANACWKLDSRETGKKEGSATREIVARVAFAGGSERADRAAIAQSGGAGAQPAIESQRIVHVGRKSAGPGFPRRSFRHISPNWQRGGRSTYADSLHSAVHPAGEIRSSICSRARRQENLSDFG